MNEIYQPEWSDKEKAAIDELAKIQELSPQQVIKTALRTYQAIVKTPLTLLSPHPVPGCPDLSDDVPEPIGEPLEEEIITKVKRWQKMSADEMRLVSGELTGQEIRTVRAVLNQILPTNSGKPEKENPLSKASAQELEFSEEDTAKLFEGTNFGPKTTNPKFRIQMMVECVFKTIAGYGDGSTIRNICIKANLLAESGKPTKKGRRWAFHQIYHDGQIQGIST